MGNRQHLHHQLLPLYRSLSHPVVYSHRLPLDDVLHWGYDEGGFVLVVNYQSSCDFDYWADSVGFDDPDFVVYAQYMAVYTVLWDLVWTLCGN